LELLVRFGLCLFAGSSKPNKPGAKNQRWLRPDPCDGHSHHSFEGGFSFDRMMRADIWSLAYNLEEIADESDFAVAALSE
jgi:hypothetical protein